MTTEPNRCRICDEPGVNVLLDAGAQPLCNRFIEDHFRRTEYQHPLILGQCPHCGTLQLVETAPAEELAPRFPWIINNEPEEHLDRLTRIMARLPGMGQESLVLGLTGKDDSTLRRLKTATGCRTWRIRPDKDLGIPRPGSGGETLQACLTPEAAKALAKKHGQADILIARHILEHAARPRLLVDVLKNLVKPGGYLVFEIPDCTDLLKTRDYTMLWEEHVLYFTPDTFQNAFGYLDLSPVQFMTFSYPVENALVAIVKNGIDRKSSHPAHNLADGELEKGSRYAGAFTEAVETVRTVLKRFAQTKGDIAMYGAGHLAITYVNLFGIGSHLTLAVDDDPNKEGLFMPGCGLPILGSQALLKKEIRLCLLSLRPELEPRIMARHEEYLARGGKFASIFPGSAIWMGKSLPEFR